ncbi:MAG: protease HtpX [Elusimicrobia bacterium]|nr:protease HtpX [Elusimicrobiota bacterium]
MQITKRIFLFVAVNILILLTISITLQVLGVRPYLTHYGIDYRALMMFCLVWGMGGAFISLALSRVMAKWMMGVRVIDPQSARGDEVELVEMVRRLAQGAGLPRMPEVGIYQSPEVNAFATGPTRGRALVAVSSGIVSAMSREELEGVLGHEISHVANGDMVTMMLIQGVVNAFVMFFARAIGFFLSQNARGENRRTVYFMTTFVLEILLSLLGAMVVAWFSRWREFRADRGGARLAGVDKMVNALRRLQRSVERVGIDERAPALASLKIAGRPARFLALFATHPPLETRIAALKR